MVKIPQNILEITSDYINKLRNQIPVEKAIMFGSYSKGTFKKDSDIDIAIFSPAFEEMSRVDGLTFLLMQALGYKIDLQPQPFTMKDYEEKTGLVSEIIKTGIEII
ncbi:MAG TPA: nucleotidyltransferase domain-containing protein [Clostridia bacterium]|nr:MAG: Nucleotidyltransferase domain protein [Firmicutes bacterium ADurb.Bin146]HOD93104.1 nucleotidyltransferase domain-containing protein [Clostridia bacterium]HQM39427.1 nucleotidyltransferase domain-containing protein [Clostridia bacterium]